MAPPSYADLGKQARDVFSKGYHFGLWKLDCKTTTASGLEFATAGQSVQDSGKISGSLETKYNVKEYGLTFSEKWNTDNTLNTEVVFKQLADGLKLSFEGRLAPQTETKTGKIKVGYGQDLFQIDTDLTMDTANNTLFNLGAVLGNKGFFVGYKTAIDLQETKVTSNNFALGYKTPKFILHTSAHNNLEDYSGSVFYKCCDKVDTALQLSYATSADEVKFGVGASCKLDADASIRSKLNNVGQLGLGYQQKLRDGITLTLSTLIDGKNLSSGVHKIGLALELEA